MSELIVKIKSNAKKKYLIKGKEIDFEELEKLMHLSIAREKMRKVVSIAVKTGLSKMTNKEINEIVKETRQQTKHNR